MPDNSVECELAGDSDHVADSVRTQSRAEGVQDDAEMVDDEFFPRSTEDEAIGFCNSFLRRMEEKQLKLPRERAARRTPRAIQKTRSRDQKRKRGNRTGPNGYKNVEDAWLDTMDRE